MLLGGSDSPGSGKKASNGIACARCRRLKVRCAMEQDSEGCIRCLAANIDCEEAVSTRKLKRKEEDRVAQLESTVAHLTNSLHSLKCQSMNQYSADSAPVNGRSILPGTNMESLNGQLTPEMQTWDALPASSIGSLPNGSVNMTKGISRGPEGIDELINSGIITEEQARRLFENIKQRMASGISIVKLPENVQYQDLYRSAPILLQALITVASSIDPLIYPALCAKMRDTLLNEFFVKVTRRLDLVQGLLLSCEYFKQSDTSAVWSSHTYVALATEVALDLNMYAPPVESSNDPLDELEYERTLIGLFVVHCSLLCGTRRQPQRVLWTEYHNICRAKLEASTLSDRELAVLTHVSLLHVEIQAAGSHMKSLDLLRHFQRRISDLDAALGSGSANAIVALNQVTLAMHESFIRFSDLNIYHNTQLFISKEICKTTAYSTLYAIESLPGNPSTIPTLIFAKPIYCLITVCKLLRFLKIDEDDWARVYAEKYDHMMASFGERGSIPAQNLFGKAGLVLRWWKEAEIAMTDSPIQVMQWSLKRTATEKADFNMDAEFRNFIEMFNITP